MGYVKERKSKTISCRVKPSTYQKLEELMDSLFIENTGDFIEFIVQHCEIKNKGLLKEYQEIIKELEERKSFYKAKLEVSLQLKTGLEEDEPPC